MSLYYWHPDLVRGDSLKKVSAQSFVVFSAFMFLVFSPFVEAATSTPPAPLLLSSGWELQDVAKATQSGAEVSSPKFKSDGWFAATVPGTVLTTLVNNHVYPEPLYGENNRPEKIPESLARSSYWYRAQIEVPKSYKGHHVWLN